jgi:16S rRNA (uracil1498-N3)-methyltransferase
VSIDQHGSLDAHRDEHRDERRRCNAQVFTDDLEALALDGDDEHHLTRVLRLRNGEQVCVADGRGSWRICVWRPGATLEPVTDVVSVSRALPEIVVGFAPAKGDRPEWVVGKLTELGVDRIVPVFTERSVVRWETDRVDRAHERLVAVARAAAAQSRSPWIPVIERPMAFGAIAATLGPFRLAEPGGAAPVVDGVPVFVGPEGGWTVDELGGATGTVGLPGGVLRSETAAVTLGALLSAERDRTLKL